MKISISTNASTVSAGLNKFVAEQVPFATARALTQSAKHAQAAATRSIHEVFDKPTPYIGRSIFATPATKARLEAVVGIKDTGGVPPSVFLREQVLAGERRGKRFEVALRRIGALPAGMLAVPGAGAALDSFGSVSRSQINEILSYFRAFESTGRGRRQNMTDQRRQRLAKSTSKRYGTAYYVSDGSRGLARGIWIRQVDGIFSRVRPVLLFVPRAAYRERFPFFDIALNVISQVLPGEFEKAIAEALRTAK